ncbi:MAG: EscU/YscU/HrcU family type III secretion system export apparatus switch protein [Neptuniibacter sp.]
MAQGQDQDRTEQATPFKLKEARKRGQVAKSLEVNSLLLLAVVLLLSYVLGEQLIQHQLQLSAQLFSISGQVILGPENAMSLLRHTLGVLAESLWPFFGAIMLTGIVANMTQTGPVFSFFPLKPDMNRLNPIQGFKRLVSKKLIFESIKTVIKMGILGSVIYVVLSAMIIKLIAMIDIYPQVYPSVMIEHAQSLAYKLLLTILLIALMDLMYSRWDFQQQMRMSRREVKEEVKRRDGDPQVKSKQRQLQKESVKRAGSVSRLPEADVLITNPTHLAIALKYERGSSSAPQIIAKGAGELAGKMRKVADRYSIPIVENKPLARALFRRSNIDDFVPDAHFPAVAKILAWVYLQRDQQLSRVNTGSSF